MKKEVSVKKSRVIDFQITLIAILCFGYWMYEVYAVPISNHKKIDPTTIYTSDSPDVEDPFGPFEIEPEAIEVPKSKPKIQPIDIVKPVADDTVDKTKVDDKTEENEPETQIETKTKSPTKKITKKVGKKTAPINSTKSGITGSNQPISSNVVDMFPVHPDCKKYSNNRDILECFEKKIQRLVQRRFNNSIGVDLGLKGNQRINVYFEIDKQGNISNIKARSKHKALAKEAKRVAKFLPKMQPAQKKGEKVTMSYILPITLDIR